MAGITRSATRGNALAELTPALKPETSIKKSFKVTKAKAKVTKATSKVPKPKKDAKGVVQVNSVIEPPMVHQQLIQTLVPIMPAPTRYADNSFITPNLSTFDFSNITFCCVCRKNLSFPNDFPMTQETFDSLHLSLLSTDMSPHVSQINSCQTNFGQLHIHDLFTNKVAGTGKLLS